MNITAATLDGLFKTFQTKFTEAQKAAQTRVTPNDLLPEDIALAFTGAGSATQHSWLEQLHGIHEWVGERVLNNAKLGKLTVVNRDFENTIKVSRNEIEDDQYGVYAPLVGMMGADAENLWKKLAIEALLGNGEWADGNPFFCSGRELGESAFNGGLGDTLVVDGVDVVAVYLLEDEIELAPILVLGLYPGITLGHLIEDYDGKGADHDAKHCHEHG